MEFIFTEDPTVIIVYKQDNITIYFQLQTEESWIIYGKCNQCGDCEVGSINPNVIWINNKTFDLTFDSRKDIPVRPEIAEHKHCSLRGVYL